MTPLLRFEGVALRRGGRLLFEDRTLDLGRGQGLQIMGPNGSGKSSLLRLAAGRLRAERGRVERAEVALADDHPAFDRALPLRRAIQFWSKGVAGALEALGLTALADVPVRLFSSGQM